MTECQEIKEQIELVYHQFQEGEVNFHQFMKLISMIYGDYIDLSRDKESNVTVERISKHIK